MKKQYTILAITLVMSSLAAAQVADRLEPQAPEGYIEMGREYISLSSNQVQVELGFDGVFGDYFVFDVVVYNSSQLPLSVDPSRFHYMLLENALADSSLLPPFRAASPDKILAYYNHSLENREELKDLNTVFGVIEGGLGILANAGAFLATEDPFYIIDAVFKTAGTAGHYIARDQSLGHAMNDIRGEQQVVREEIMRAGEIPAGKVLSGYVFFPEYDEAGYIMFCIPAGDEIFQFVYNQGPVSE